MLYHLDYFKKISRPFLGHYDQQSLVAFTKKKTHYRVFVFVGLDKKFVDNGYYGRSCSEFDIDLVTSPHFYKMNGCVYKRENMTFFQGIMAKTSLLDKNYGSTSSMRLARVVKSYLAKNALVMSGFKSCKNLARWFKTCKIPAKILQDINSTKNKHHT